MKKRKMMKILDDWRNWLYIVIVLIILIFFFFGFLLGYLYTDKACISDPFSYGIKKINSMNHVNLTCSCFSPTSKVNPFSFDEEGIKFQGQ